jgi:hypothetical protein
MDNFKCIKLIHNSKMPIQSWKNKKEAQYNYNDIDSDKYNIGIITGKINNIIVVDIDLYKMEDDNIFLKEFKNYKKIDTLINKTPRGGYHLYFNYDESLYNVASNIQVDIRSDNGYIVAPPSSIEGNQYTIYKNKPIIDIPEDLKEFLLNNVCKRETKETKEKKDKGEYVDNGFLKDLEDKDIDKLKTRIIKKLDGEKKRDNFFKSYDEFLYFTTSMKKLNLQKSWDDFNKSQKDYNYISNMKIWDSVKDIDMTKWLLKKLSFNVYELYKPTIKNIITPHKIINRQKLGYDLIKEDKNYIIKSDTGTGKTTTFKEYIKTNNLKFISICSRVSLCEEQYFQFNKHGIDCILYNIDEIQNNKSCVIQLDSLAKIYNIENYSNYVLFLDEFNSIISYLIQSSTLKNHRVNVFTLLIKLIKECKHFICVDADISDMSINFIDFCKRPYKYILNEYLHNKGIEAEEIFNYDLFIQKLNKEDKFLLCTDSKTQAEIIYKKLDDDDIKLITSENDEYVNFDENNKIIYSPKIIYGIDSTLPRNVYCLYTERTINPKSMIQQIARCRNIKKLYFIFINKSYNDDLTTFEDHKKDLKLCNDYSLKEFKLLSSLDIYNLYFELVCIYSYNELCYKTNKFGHFIKLINDRGFKYNMIMNNVDIDKKELIELKKDLLNEKLENFDINNKKHMKLNEILKVPEDRIDEFKEYFIDSYRLSNHFIISRFMRDDYKTLKEDLNNKADFNINKIQSTENKIKFLKLLKKLTYNEDIYSINSQPAIFGDIQKLNEEYKIICDGKNNKDFNNTYICNQIQYKLYNDIFNEFDFISVCNKHKEQLNKVRQYKYTVNKEYFEKDIDLLNFRLNVLDEKIKNKKRLV